MAVFLFSSYSVSVSNRWVSGESQVSLRWVSGATSRVQELQFGAGWAFALLQSDCRGRCVSELYLLLTWMKSPESWNLLSAAFHEFRCFLLKQHKQKHWSVINNLKGRIFNNWVFRVKHVSQTNIHIWASQIRNHSSSFRLLLPVSWSFGSWSLSDDWTLVLAVGRSGFLTFWFPSLVSEELSEAVAIVPAPQGLTLPWPPPVIFDPDPWHVHLDLHRRSCPETSSRWVPLCQSSSTAGGLHHVRLRGLHPCWEEPACTWKEVQCYHASSQLSSQFALSDAVVFLCRRSGSSSSEVGGSQHKSRYRRLSAPPSSSSETPPCCSLSATREEEDPDPPSFRGSRGDLAFPDYSLGLTESSTPITTSLQQDQQENRSTQKETSNSVLEGRSSRTLRFTRQQSVGGASSHSQVYYPFPSRKTPRISEAAKRLGMYSSIWGGPGSAAGRTRGASQGSIRDQSIHEPILWVFKEQKFDGPSFSELHRGALIIITCDVSLVIKSSSC